MSLGRDTAVLWGGCDSGSSSPLLATVRIVCAHSELSEPPPTYKYQCVELHLDRIHNLLYLPIFSVEQFDLLWRLSFSAYLREDRNVSGSVNSWHQKPLDGEPKWNLLTTREFKTKTTHIGQVRSWL